MALSPKKRRRRYPNHDHEKNLFLILTFGIASQSEAQSPVLTEGFKRADTNGDGKLSADEVNQFPQLKGKLQGADKDGDGFITFEEFRTQLIAGARPPSTPSLPATRLTAG